MPVSYDVGDLVPIHGQLMQANGSPLDPSNAYCQVRPPDGVLQTFQHGVDSSMIRDDVGLYHVDVTAHIAGTWFFRFYSTGTGQGSEEGSFYVEPSQFD
jgi:hypothetical protein